ncbi:OLC1v1000442C2 [Oldenlandia corymbosa var. corymbosa]|nr:OLC1v1000442C2 [Oldenlandia corymbosa var. corymbosa]
MPKPLLPFREEELKNLRGDGTGERQEWDRVYDYAYYNDLGDPDKGTTYVRPVLGGSPEYPYPRRGRTGRPPTKTDPKSESRLPVINGINIYVPRDERFGHLKMSDFIAYALKSAAQVFLPEFESLISHGKLDKDYDNLEEIYRIYEDRPDDQPAPTNDDGLLRSISGSINSEILKELLRNDKEKNPKFPVPKVIKGDKSAWKTDAEFCRQMVAGVNPVIISLLKEFPPRSKLNPEIYGKQDSTITREQVENMLDGLTVDKAMETNRLFILDHHDSLMPYVRRINATSTKIYATRTLLFLQEDGTLKPLAIELSLPNPNGDEFGAVSKVYTPGGNGVEGSLWQLAKTYVAVNDSGVHQLISHWLHTHAVIEPIVIATNRQLSVVHPIHKLLHPHFRDTMTINALARQTLTNAGGFIESTVFPGKYAMEMSAVLYKDWVFPEHALPADLIKRGMAVEDPNARHGLRLLIQDYPFAVDGLEIWSAIKTWVEDYCKYYYRSDEMIQEDEELQSWWKEVREEGHGDKKDEPWWPKMQSRQELIDSCTIIIWLSSALHAAVNFGQYPYAGFLPNRPTLSRRLIPEPGTPEYDELKTDPDKVLLKTVPPQLQMLLGISLIEILSRHASDEVYLGQRDHEWTNDVNALEAFERFGKKLAEIEGKIVELNNNPGLKNRSGSVKVPYTLLFPTGEVGLSGKGIPNSISI